MIEYKGVLVRECGSAMMPVEPAWWDFPRRLGWRNLKVELRPVLEPGQTLTARTPNLAGDDQYGTREVLIVHPADFRRLKRLAAK